MGVLWLVGLSGLAVWTFGGVFAHTDWSDWATAAREAAFSLPRVFIRDPGGLFSLVMLAGATLIGRALLRRVLPEPPSPALAAAAGLSLMALAAFGLGAVRLFRPLALIGMTWAFLAAGMLDLMVSRRRRESLFVRACPFRPLEWAALFGFSGIVLITAVNPSLFYDALSYHLSLPRQYLIAGSIAPFPWHPFSYFPGSAEMLFGTALAGGGWLSAQLFSAGVWMLGILLIRELAVQARGPAAGPWAMLTALSILSFALSALFVTADPLVLLLVAAALFCLRSAFLTETGRDSRAFRGWLLGWAFFAGAGAGVKYTVWITGLGLQGLILLGLTRRLRRPEMKTALLALALALIVLLPWPLRDFWASGNPVQPVPAGFGQELLPPAAWQALKENAHQVTWTAQNFLPNLSAPWRMAFSKWDRLDTEWGAAAYLGPMIWMGAPLVLLFRRKERKLPASLWLFALLATALSLAQFRMTRFAYPGLAAFTVLAGIGLHDLWQAAKGRQVLRLAMMLALASALLLNAALFMRATANFTAGYRFPRLRADLPRYLADRVRIEPRVAQTAALQLEANRVLPAGAKVLLVGETRFFFLTRPAVAPSFLSPNPLLLLLGRSADPETAQALIKDGLTYLLISRPELQRLAQVYHLPGATPELAEKAWQFSHGPFCRPVAEDPAAQAVICELQRSPSPE